MLGLCGGVVPFFRIFTDLSTSHKKGSPIPPLYPRFGFVDAISRKEPRALGAGRGGELGPAPINSEKRPQADTSLSRPVWPQFCFYPLRIIPQGTQSQGLRMWSVFGGVENSMFLGLG